MKIPPYLKKGTKIGITAPARPCSNNSLKESIALIKSWECEVVLGKTINRAAWNQFSATDLQRAEDLQSFLDDPEINAIWCARGGYGTIRILDLLNFNTFKKNPKWLLGYSDITVLHLKIQQLKIASLHTILPIEVKNTSKKIVEKTKKVLFGETINYAIPNNINNRIGTAHGEIIGGNLSILYSLLGTKTLPNVKRKIMFLEDVGEYVYHIDRMLISLKRADIFENLAGLIVGSFTKMKDKKKDPFGISIEKMIKKISEPYDFPICFGFPAGHTKKNFPLPLGIKTKMIVNNDTANFSFKL